MTHDQQLDAYHDAAWIAGDAARCAQEAKDATAAGNYARSRMLLQEAARRLDKSLALHDAAMAALAPCIDCDGDGIFDPCDECDGKGSFQVNTWNMPDDTRGYEFCDVCEGSGQRPDDDLFNKWTTCEHTAWQAPGYLCCVGSRQITSRDEMLRLLGGAS